MGNKKLLSLLTVSALLSAYVFSIPAGAAYTDGSEAYAPMTDENLQAEYAADSVIFTGDTFRILADSCKVKSGEVKETNSETGEQTVINKYIVNVDTVVNKVDISAYQDGKTNQDIRETIVIEPIASGTLTANVKIGNNKTVVLLTDGAEAGTYTAVDGLYNTTGADIDGYALTVSAEAGKKYYVGGAGTSPYIYSVSLVSDGQPAVTYEPIVTADPDATPDPTPIAAAPLTAVSQSTAWTFESVINTSYTAETNLFDDTLKVNAEAGKAVAVDSSSKTFDGTKYTAKIKLGGTGTAASRSLEFLPGADGTVKVYALSGSTGATRDLKLEQNGAVIGTVTVTSDIAESFDEIPVAAGSPVQIYSADSGINIYAIVYTVGGEAPPVNPTQPPSEDKCVKIVASYDTNGVFTGMTTTEVSVSEATAAVTDGNTKIFYWNTLSDMTPVTGSAPKPTTPPSTGDEDVTPITAPETAVVGSGITLSAEDFEVGTYTETLVKNNIYFGAAEEKTLIITKNDATIAGVSYTQRIQTGGTSNAETGVKSIYFRPDSDITIKLAATSSNSDPRELTIYHGTETKKITVSGKDMYTINGIKANENVVIASNGGLNVYSISLTAPEKELTAVAAATTWTFDALLDTSYAADTFIFDDTMKLYASENAAVSIVSSSKTFEDVKYTVTAKLGGTGSASSRSIEILPAVAGTIKVYALSASTDTERVLNVEQSGTVAGTVTVNSEAAESFDEIPVAAGAPVQIYSSSSGINIYAVMFTPAVN